MNDLTKEELIAYIEAAINLEAQTVAEVAEVAARAAFEVASLDQISIGAEVDTAVLTDAMNQQRVILISEYLVRVFEDYAVEFAGVDAAIALQEIKERNQV